MSRFTVSLVGLVALVGCASEELPMGDDGFGGSTGSGSLTAAAGTSVASTGGAASGGAASGGASAVTSSAVAGRSTGGATVTGGAAQVATGGWATVGSSATGGALASGGTATGGAPGSGGSGSCPAVDDYGKPISDDSGNTYSTCFDLGAGYTCGGASCFKCIGKLDCDGKPGCERTITSNDCGSCGRLCANGETCKSDSSGYYLCVKMS